MIHVIPSVAAKWYQLGVLLLDSNCENELNTIEADTIARNDAETCCRKMFSRWLNTDEQASWDKLIRALRHIQLNNVASDCFASKMTQCLAKLNRPLSTSATTKMAQCKQMPEVSM